MSVDPKPMAVGGHRLPPEVLESLQQAAAKTGVDFGFLVAQASVESGFNAEAVARHSSAAGLFQFTSQTWFQMVRQHGAHYGYGELAKAIQVLPNGRLGVKDPAVEKQILDLRSNVDVAALMAAEFAKGNAARLQRALGRTASAADLHLAHLLGPNGAIRFLKAREAGGEQAAAKLVPAAARQNPQIFYGHGRTPQSVAAVYRHVEATLAGPLRQVAALESETAPAAGRSASKTSPTHVALKPGLGLLASLSNPPKAKPEPEG
ncbi:MAG TPA: transglycosylase SLT domain-containing protein [Stellaceae bacterium]|nr:transglycosylase SLT domain-containing protein [Stellaceae bacterium]